MEDEDIKIVEEFIKYFEAEAISRKYRRNISITVGEDDIEAIENLLSRLKTAERMNNVLAEHISERCHYIDDYSNSCDVIEDSCYENKDCKECIKEWARKKVENEEK